MTTCSISFSRPKLPRHEDLAAAYLAAVSAVLGCAFQVCPEVERINEDYGSRQEEHYRYGGRKMSLTAHAVGMMSGHGRHGSKTRWRGEGFPLSGESQLYGLGNSYARLDLSWVDEARRARAAEAFAGSLEAWDIRLVSDGAAIAVVNDAVGRWQTGTTWSREPLVADLRKAVAESALRSAPGATARFLLARLLLIDRHLEEAEGLLVGLAASGAALAFCRGLSCGLSADGSLWYVYRPHTTAPPCPHMEVLLALGWCAELRGQPGEAAARYREILTLDRSGLRGAVRPDEAAEAQLARLEA